MKEASVTSQNVIAAPRGEPARAQTAGKCSGLKFGGQKVGAAVWGGWDRAGSEQLSPLRPEILGNLSVEKEEEGFLHRHFDIHGDGAVFA